MTDGISQVIRRRKRQDRLFNVLGIACTMVGMLTLSALIVKLVGDGWAHVDGAFLTSYPSFRPERAGILSPWVGSLAVMVVTGLTAVPLGIAAGVYLEEYGRRNRLSQFIEVNISNLAGVPSIIYGLLAVGMFISFWKLSPNVLVGGLTLAMLILPIVIVATREALRTIPRHIREAAYALGATKWQVIRHHLLPYSLGGIATGVIIALSRAIGETAPLMVVGAVGVIRFLPDSPLTSDFPFLSFQWLQSPYTVLPLQMFNWTSEPKESFHRLAAATGLILILVTLSMNAVAILVRYRARKRIKW